MANKVENQEAADRFWELALAMEIKGDRWRSSSYLRASRSIEEISEPLLSICERGELRNIEGVGDSIAAKLEELLTTGRIEALEAVRHLLPDDLPIFRDAPVLGIGRVAEMVNTIGVRSVDTLLRAIDEGMLSAIPGLSEDVEMRIREWLVWRREESAEIPTPYAISSAERIMAYMRQGGIVSRTELSGPARRKVAAVANITLLFTSPSPDLAVAKFGTCPEITELTVVDKDLAVGKTSSGVGCMLREVQEQRFVLENFRRTGPEAHVDEVLAALEVRNGPLSVDGGVFSTEAEIYERAGTRFVPPEMRERGEADANIVTKENLRGDLHVRSILMDGTIQVKQLADAAVSLGHSFICICDHFGILVDGEQLARRNEMIDEASSRSSLTLLKGIEVDIAPNGRLDAPSSLLEGMDLVIASVNTKLNMGEEEMKKRIIHALDDPNMDVLGHPCGRILGLRERTVSDLRSIAERAVERRVALEINAHPDRQDLDDNDAYGLYEVGAFYSLGTDSSYPLRHHDWDWAVTMARKAHIGQNRMLNTLSPHALQRRAWRK
jgi:DNA polymerase (family X)